MLVISVISVMGFPIGNRYLFTYEYVLLSEESLCFCSIETDNTRYYFGCL